MNVPQGLWYTTIVNVALLIALLIASKPLAQPLTITPISDHIAIQVTSFESANITQATREQWDYPTANAIIDLRNNLGGNLYDAVAFGALFVTKNNLIPLRTSDGNAKMITRPTDHPVIPTNRLIILINNQTASAAEASAHVLSHHPNSVLIGTTTHGKVSISTPKANPYNALLIGPVTPNITWAPPTTNDHQTLWLKAMALANQNEQRSTQYRSKSTTSESSTPESGPTISTSSLK